jgi:hypothetical protein
MDKILGRLSEDEFQRRLAIAELPPKFKATIIRLRKKQIEEIKEENETNLQNRR